MQEAETTDDGEELLSSKEVAKRLGVRPKTMDTWAYEGRGPDYTRMGRLRKYKRADVEAYIESNMVRHG